MEKNPQKFESSQSASSDRMKRSRILYQSYLSRRSAGENIETEDFVRMFPQYEKELRSLFEKVRSRTASHEDLFAETDRGDTSKKDSKILGDFRIIREIGSGGMATVFEAEQISLKRKVALKVLPAHLSLSERAVKRFRREAEAGSRQRHPGIVAIYAVGQHEDMHFIAEELVGNGFTLADRLEKLRKKGTLPIGYYRRTAKLILSVAEALNHAHASSVFHRDIKPSNILLNAKNDPVVTDFGLAKIEDALNLSRTGDFCGTPFYMSPEQAMSSRIGIDHRTDIYSLGVTLYECLTLKVPFKGKSPTEVLKKVLFKEAVDPREVNPKVPGDLALICLKAMEKDPGHRYQTMQELADDLGRYIHGEVILAKPAGPGKKLIKIIKRNRLMSSAVSLIFLIVISFLSYILWSYPQILNERNHVTHINRFLVDVLFAPHPEQEGNDVTMIEAIDRATAKMQDGFVTDPETEIEIRNTIGSVYQGLGGYDRAVIQHRRAWELSEKELGSEHIATLRSRNDLGCALMFSMNANDWLEAETHLLSARDGFEKRYGNEADETLQALNNLAVVFHKLEREEEAEAFHREVLATRMKVLGPLHKDTLTTRNNLGAVLLEQKKYQEAQKMIEEVYQDRKQVLKEDHPDTLRSRFNLACCYTRLGKYESAESHFKETYYLQAKKLKKGHPHTLKTLEELHELLFEQERIEEALSLADELLEYYNEPFDEEGVRKKLRYTIRKAIILTNSGQFKDAEELFNNGNRIARDALPRIDLERADFFRIHASFLFGVLKDYNRAEKLLLECFEVYLELHGNDHEVTQEVIAKLVRIYIELKDEENESLFRNRLN